MKVQQIAVGLCTVACCAMTNIAAAGSSCAMEWSAVWPQDPTGTPRKLEVFDDGTGSALYIAGWLGTVDGIPAPLGVVKWDGSTLTALPGLPDGGTVRDMAVYDEGNGPALYLGGNFFDVDPAPGSTYGGMVKWDGRALSAVLTDPGTVVNALTVFDPGTGPMLIAGGTINNDPGTIGFVKQWSGGIWESLGIFSGFSASGVYALAAINDGPTPALYAGGHFLSPVENIGQWNGARWQWMSGGYDAFDSVTMLEVQDVGSGDILYADSAGDGLRAWDPTREMWSDVLLSLHVEAMTLFDDGGGPMLWVGGAFTSAGGQPAQDIAKFDGAATWTPILPGANDTIRDMEVFDDGHGPVLYVVGEFSSIGGVIADGFARFGGPAFPEDLNGDGSVDGVDLATLLSFWGSCPGCPSDLNCDGIVNGFDLATLLAAWTS